MMDDKGKIEALERILMAITYADEITYKPSVHGLLLDRIRFHGASPDYLVFRGYAEGLDLDWDAESHGVEIPEELGGGITDHPRLVGEVWVQEDLWKTVQELRKQLSEFATDDEGVKSG